MPPREQLTLPAVAANDVTLDDVLGPSRRASAGDRAMAAQAGPDAPVVARRQANVRRGKVAQKHGREFEDWLTAQHRAMCLPGPGRLLAWAHHLEAAAKYLHDQRAGEKRLTHVAKAAADYVAMSTRAWGSRTIVVEAKTVYGQGERLSLEEIRPQQVDHLVETWREGGVALVAVEFRQPGPKGHVDVFERFAIPWGEIPWRVGGRGGWSIGPEDLTGFEVPPETGPRRAFYLRRHIEAA